VGSGIGKKNWRAFFLNKKQDRAVYLWQFHLLFVPALEIFWQKVETLDASEQEKQKAQKLADLLSLLQMQTHLKIAGQTHIKDRIVSLDEVDARPIKRGKHYPDCEFGTTLQMSFNRQGFMVTTENFIGARNEKTLYPATLDQFQKRMKGDPDTVVTDLGCRSAKNLRLTKAAVVNVFMGRTDDVSKDQQAFCKSARSATEGFIAVAKNLRGFGCSLYRGLLGDRIWTLLCQTAFNLKKFLQLYRTEDIEESSLMKLGLLG
jgi:transposase, IS5 family